MPAGCIIRVIQTVRVHRSRLCTRKRSYYLGYEVPVLYTLISNLDCRGPLLSVEMYIGVDEKRHVYSTLCWCWTPDIGWKIETRSCHVAILDKLVLASIMVMWTISWFVFAGGGITLAREEKAEDNSNPGRDSSA